MRPLAGVLLALASGVAMAHDTWFELQTQTQSQTAPVEVALALGTGTRFPVFEFPIGIEQIVTSGCRGDGVAATPLTQREDRPRSLLLGGAAPGGARATLSCWAQLAPVEAAIEPRIVEIYLDEIQASAAVRAAWAEQQRRGVPWRESYTKHARIEFGGRGVPMKAQPSPMAMDVLLQAPRTPIRQGDALVFQVLHKGKPLAGLAVELHRDDGRPGEWRQTDAKGRVWFRAPKAGRSLLRGTDLRRSPTDPDRWVGGFLTLAFDVID